tara:strand:- start:95754 stop:96047 length:294 start_codon:yes stop_codon:yes gene_type:complete
MDHPEGARETGDGRLGFDRRVRLEFRGTQHSSDGGLLVMRELDALKLYREMPKLLFFGSTRETKAASTSRKASWLSFFSAILNRISVGSEIGRPKRA